ncbi:MAG TPA: polysaccharide deacetylase family protein [Vicinamibacteria bacterium]|nr:polysaccharide deacetylase family protein [Vicinamibacteria bacterium]
MSARPPAVLVGIDTEADDQWSARGRQEMGVRNAARLPALQALFEEFGVRPTYVVTWEMATRPESAAVLRDLARTGRCEIGTHLHPWSSPPFRPEDLAAHTYPHNLPEELLDRQLRELTAVIQEQLGVRPTTYRAGRNGFDGRTLPILERLGYTVDTSVDPLFNERRKGGMIFDGAPIAPYHPDYADVRRPGASKILEIPITSATLPGLPKVLERAYARLRPIPWRGAFKRLGLRPVWLRPSYTPLADMLTFADRLRRAGAPCFNLIFHSSEVLPGGSPYTPDEKSVARFLDDLRRLLAHLTGPLGAQGRTYAEFAREWAG